MTGCSPWPRSEPVIQAHALTRNWTDNLLVLQHDAQPTEPHQPGLTCGFYLHFSNSAVENLFMHLLAICVFLREVSRSSAHFLNWIFFWCWVVWILYIFCISTPCRVVVCKYLLPFDWLPFCFAGSFFCCADTFYFDIVSFIYFCLYFSCLGVQFIQSSLRPRWISLVLMNKAIGLPSNLMASTPDNNFPYSEIILWKHVICCSLKEQRPLNPCIWHPLIQDFQEFNNDQKVEKNKPSLLNKFWTL